MKFFIYLTVSLYFFASCSHKVITVAIEQLQIDTVITGVDSLPQTIVLRDIEIVPIKYEYDKKQKLLTVTEAKVISMIELSEVKNDSIINLPNFDNLEFEEVRIQNPDPNEFKFLSPAINIKNPVIKTISINSVPFIYDGDKTVDEYLRSLYAEVEKELAHLRDSINEVINAEPDNAFRTLVESKYFDEIDEKMRDINLYINQTHRSRGITEEKIRVLEGIKIDLSYLWNQFDNPRIHPVSFYNDLLFEPGEYEITSIKNLAMIDKYIDTIKLEIDARAKIKDTIKVNIIVGGYADDLDIGVPLNKTLSDLYNKDPEMSYNQDSLNYWLSDQRAKSTLDYIIKKIQKYYANGDLHIIFDDSVPIGHGRLFPIGVNPSDCPEDNCYKRRIVNVARLII